MREIKFRGKRIDNEKWVYGYYAVKEGYHYIFDRFDFIKIYPNTKGQYIGLKDIFEDDIVEDNIGIGVIEYVKEYAAFRVNYNGITSCKWFYDFLDSELKCIEVIGNIHENHEILDVTKT